MAFKLIKPVKLPAPLHKEWRRLQTSRTDLEEAYSYAIYILEKRLHDGRIRRKSGYFHSRAFATALIVSYARAFNDPKNWEAKLLALVKPSAKELALHTNVLLARNRLFAHSDLRNYRNRPARRGYERWEMIDQDTFEFSRHDVETMRSFALRLSQAVNLTMANIVDRHLVSS